MSSSQLRSLSIATESSFCGLTASNQTPTSSGLTFTVVDVLDIGQLIVEGEAVADDPSAMRGGSYSMPARPVFQDGKPVARGSFSFDFYLKGWSSTDKGIPELLKTRFDTTAGSGFESLSTATSGSQAVTVAGSVTTSAGGVCVVESDAGSVFGLVCSYTSATSFSLTPNIVSRGADPGNDLSVCWTLSLPTAGLPSTSSTCCIKITGQGWTQTLYGCSLTSLSMSGSSDSRGVRCSATVDVAFVDTVVNSGTPAVLAADADAPILHQLGSPLALSTTFYLSTGGFASGFTPNSNTMTAPGQCVDEWTLNIEFATSFSSCGSFYVGRSRSETTSVTTTLELHIGATALYSDFVSQWESLMACNAILGFTGANDARGAIVLPAAVVSEFTPAPDLGSDFVRTSITLAAGPCPTSSIPAVVIALRAP